MSSYVAKDKEMDAAAPAVKTHRTRITLTSRNVKNLEKVCTDLVNRSKDKDFRVKLDVGSTAGLLRFARAASSAESAPSFLDVVEEEMGDNSDDNPFKMDIDIDSPVCIAPSELLPPPSPRPRARHASILDAPRFSFPSTPFALLPSTTLRPISTKLPLISESDEDSEEDKDEDADEAAWLPKFVHLPALRRPYTRKHVGPWRKARKEDSLEWLRLATLSRCHQAGTLPGEVYGAIEVDMEL
ncbi:uncharacterized protein JCM10292_005772 [Rhodotorula paludigena]|uniref:uncharacterized protein n=1 Tax=Rhodotorula paludigena TaxID=86838 RepID=UPI00317AC459